MRFDLIQVELGQLLPPQSRREQDKHDGAIPPRPTPHLEWGLGAAPAATPQLMEARQPITDIFERADLRLGQSAGLESWQGELPHPFGRIPEGKERGRMRVGGV